jgi:hypothetical protein
MYTFELNFNYKFFILIYIFKFKMSFDREFLTLSDTWSNYFIFKYNLF